MNRLIPLALAAAFCTSAQAADLPVIGALPVVGALPVTNVLPVVGGGGLPSLDVLSALPALPTTLPANGSDLLSTGMSLVGPLTSMGSQVTGPVLGVVGSVTSTLQALPAPALPIDLPDTGLTPFLDPYLN